MGRANCFRDADPTVNLYFLSTHHSPAKHSGDQSTLVPGAIQSAEKMGLRRGKHQTPDLPLY